MAEEELVTICDACAKGVIRENMKYVNGRTFHPDCYEKYGKDFVVDQDFARKTRRLKIELALLKNLKVRNIGAVVIKAPTSKSMRKNPTKAKRKKKTMAKAKRKTTKKRIRKRTKIKRRQGKKTKSRQKRHTAKGKTKRKTIKRKIRKPSRKARRRR